MRCLRLGALVTLEYFPRTRAHILVCHQRFRLREHMTDLEGADKPSPRQIAASIFASFLKVFGISQRFDGSGNRCSCRMPDLLELRQDLWEAKIGNGIVYTHTCLRGLPDSNAMNERFDQPEHVTEKARS